MTQDEQICSLALTRIPGLGLTGALKLVSNLGSATRVFEHRKELSQLVPGVSDKVNSEASFFQCIGACDAGIQRHLALAACAAIHHSDGIILRVA